MLAEVGEPGEVLGIGPRGDVHVHRRGSHLGVRIGDEHSADAVAELDTAIAAGVALGLGDGQACAVDCRQRAARHQAHGPWRREADQGARERREHIWGLGLC